MKRCAQCGAEAVSAEGLCGNCGWQMPEQAQTEAQDQTRVNATPSTALDIERDNSPSLGETRAADVLPAKTVGVSRTPSPSAGPTLATREGDRTIDMPPRYTPPSQTGRPAGARFCGTCGAAVQPAEAFCGQCGSPLSTSGSEYAAARVAPGTIANRRPTGASLDWQADDPNALTEAYLAPAPAGSGYRPGARVPSYPIGAPYSGVPVSTSVTAGAGRSVRVALGVLCLIGSLASAAGAVLLALPR